MLGDKSRGHTRSKRGTAKSRLLLSCRTRDDGETGLGWSRESQCWGNLLFGVHVVLNGERREARDEKGW